MIALMERKNKMEEYLHELMYQGELYHYTNDKGAKNILNPELTFPKPKYKFPEGCLSLQFKRIDFMTRNDNKERKHIRDMVLSLLSEYHNIGLDGDFVKKVLEYNPTEETFYSTITDKKDPIFNREIIKWDYAPCDYYVACFSTNPYNKHIIKEFKADYIFSLKECFAAECNSRGRFSRFYPFLALNDVNLNYDLKKVAYTSQQLSDIILNELLHMQQTYTDMERLKQNLQDLYAKYDAFVKEQKYLPEEEVRFVVTIPQGYDTKTLNKHNIFFKGYQQPDDNGQMFLPIDKTIFLKDVRQV